METIYKIFFTDTKLHPNLSTLDNFAQGSFVAQ